MNILEFTTETEAQTALAIVNEVAANYWRSQGYAVLDVDGHKELVGKKNGADNPNACRTITWDTIKESPDGTFYFSSPANDQRFVDWRDYLPEGVEMPADKEFPEEWKVVEEE